MASPGNRYCANCIGTLSFPITSCGHNFADCWPVCIMHPLCWDGPSLLFRVRGEGQSHRPKMPTAGWVLAELGGQLGGLGERCKLPQRDPAAKSFLAF